MTAPTTIGQGRIEAFLKAHGGHWLFVGTSVGGPYIGCNNCCRVTTPKDWPGVTYDREDGGHRCVGWVTPCRECRERWRDA